MKIIEGSISPQHPHPTSPLHSSKGTYALAYLNAVTKAHQIDWAPIRKNLESIFEWPILNTEENSTLTEVVKYFSDIKIMSEIYYFNMEITFDHELRPKMVAFFDGLILNAYYIEEFGRCLKNYWDQRTSNIDERDSIDPSFLTVVPDLTNTMVKNQEIARKNIMDVKNFYSDEIKPFDSTGGIKNRVKRCKNTNRSPQLRGIQETELNEFIRLSKSFKVHASRACKYMCGYKDQFKVFAEYFAGHQFDNTKIFSFS